MKHFMLRPREAWREEQRAWREYFGRRRLERLGITAHYASMPKGPIPPDYADLWQIYRLIRQKQPKLVYELGSGCSTSIIAQALADNGNGGMVSFDDSEHWLGQTRNYFPEHLLELCEFKPVGLRFEGEIVYYEDCTGDPDFVYVDGPPYTRGARITGNAVNLAPAFILIDGRRKTFQWTAEQLPSYQVVEDPVLNQRWLEKPAGS